MNHPLFPAATTAAVRRPLRRASQLLPLEQRFMFDGAAADAAHAAQAHESAPPPPPPAVTVRAAEPARDEGRKEVVLVDTSLANYKSLEAGVRAGVGIVEFDGSRDGLAQIAQWAASQRGLDAIHILAHGAQGVLNLGSARLTEASLGQAATQAELAQLGQALTADGDLLLYGCDIAAGSGTGLLDGLARATGADVAASTDLTGAARLGGNWTLEKHSGIIEARELALQQYDGVLDTVSFNDSDVPNPYMPSTINKLVANTTGIGSPSVNIAFFSEQMAFDAGGLYAYDGRVNGDDIQLTITAQSGYCFDLTGLAALANTGMIKFTLTYADGSPGNNFTQYGVPASGSMGNISALGMPINNVTKIVITSDSYAIFQNFIITDVQQIPPPPTTTVTGATLSADTGTSGTDFITGTAAQTISGTLSSVLGAGEWIQVSYDNGTSWSNATGSVVGSQSWSTATTLAGSSTFLARVANAGGKGSAYAHAYQVDTTAPTISFSGLALSDDTGTSGSDFITNTSAQTISATLSAAPAAGDIVYGSLDNGATWINITSKVSGTTLTWNGVNFAEGSNTLQLRVTDLAGNDGTATSRAYTLDTTAPTTSFTGISLSADTGVNSTDFITRTPGQTIGATLSGAPAGTDIVWGSLDGGGSWTNITSKVSGTTLSWNGATLGVGSNAIMLKVTDAAGNDSSLSFQNYTLDTTAPTTSVATASFSADTGTSATDFITKTAAQTISGTLSANLASGESVYVSLDNGATWAAASATVGQNTWSLAGQTLAGSSTLKVKVSDTAGNDGAVLSQAYTFDTSSPTITFNGLALSADTGASNTDFVTRTAAQTIGATLSSAPGAGDIVYGSLDNGATWTDITSKISGTILSWNGVTLAGSDTLQLKVVDAAGNTGSVKTQAYVLDTSTPATPGTPVLATASDTGAQNNDRITSDTTPTLSGTAENGSTVTVFDGATLLGTVTAGAGGWTLTTGALAEGSHTITVVSTDTAGNASAASAALTIEVDSTAPVVATVAVPANGTYYSGGALDFTVNFNEAVLVDTAGGTPRITLVVGATTRYAEYVSGSGTSALVFRYTVPSGDIDANGITVGALSTQGGTLRDTAGNDAVVTLNSVGSTAGVNVDGSNPSVTGVGASTADGAYGAGQTITITVDFSTAVNVDTTGGTPTLALDGGGQATYAGGSGTSTLTFSYTVGAGQNSADLDYSSSAALVLNGATIVDAGGAHQPADVTLATPGTAGSLGANKDLVIDSAAPTNTVANATFSADTGTSSTDFITKTAAQTISGTLAASLAAGEHVYVSLDNGATWNLATASTGANTWSLAGQTLAGSGTLQVRVSDAAGNHGAAYTQAYVLDTTAPTVGFSGVALSADTGPSNTDLITNTAAQTVSATLSAPLAAGDIVYGSLDNGATWSDITAKVAGTTLSWDGVVLSGSDTLKLKVVDAAGNDGVATSAAYVLDTSAPATGVASVAFSNDSGASSSDFITKTAAQTVSGTLSANLAAGERVLVSLDNGATWAIASTTVGQNTWSLSGQTLTASNTLLVKVADTAGNDGVATSQAYVLDTAAPATPGAPTLAPGNDSGASGSDGITNVSSPTFTGTAESGSTVTLYDGATVLGTAIATGGNWSFSAASLGNGSHAITVTSTDTAGNVSSASAALNISIDTIAPAVGSVAVPADATYGSGDALDFTVNFGEAVTVDTSGGTPRIALVVGATTRYAEYVSGSGSSALLFRYTVPNGDSDANGITVGALSLNGGSVKDAAGNDAVTTLNSVASTAGVNVDGLNASVTGVQASTADGAYGVGATITITVNFSSAVNVDTSGGTPTLALDGGGTATYTGGSGTGTLTFSYVVAAGQNSADLDVGSTAALALNGATILKAGGSQRAADVTLAAPGAAGSLGANNDIVIDTAAPTNTVATAAFSNDSGASASDFITNISAQTIGGTLAASLAAGEHVYVSLDNGATWNLATASTGANTWSLAGQTLAGSGTLQVRVSDAAGNHGAAYTQAYVLDTTAPTVGFSGVALSADTGPSNTDLITNTAAQTVSATLSAPLAAGDIVYGSLDNGATWSDITAKVAGTTLSWDGVVLSGSDTLKLKVVDAAGNDGVATSAAYVLDTSAPATGVASVAFSNDSGASSSDFITKTAAQTVSGTLSANLAAGERVLVSLDNGATWAIASTTVGQNTWSLSGQTLTASNTLLVKVADTAGNDGVATSQAYVYDTAASVPTVDTTSSMSTTPVLSGSATLAAGETMTVTVGGATYAVVPAAGTWSLDLATAVPLSGTLTLALNQRYDVVASVTDLAGNVASDSSNGELTIGTLVTQPTTGITGAALSADTGASNSDFITNVAQQTIGGSLSAPLAASESVQVSLDNGATWQTAASSGSGWSLAGVTLASGSNTLLVKVSNSAGDGPVYAHAYVLDTVAPVATATSATLSGENVLSGSLSAPLAAGESVLVSRDGGASWQVAGVSGNSWSLAGVAAGQVQVVVRDTAGNNGAILTAQVSVPVTPPVVVVPPVRVLPEAPAPADKVAEKAPASAAAGALPGVLAPDTLALFSPSSGAGGGRAADVARSPLAPVSIAALTNPAMLLTAFTPTGLPELPSRSDALFSQVPIGDKAFGSGERISVQLAPDTFVQSGGGTPFQLSAQQADGRPLPAWLSFDSRTARFEGTAPPGFEGTLHFTVTARDAQGRIAVQTFKIVITRDGQVIKTSARDAGPAEPVGRPGLSAQLGAVRGAGAERLAALSRSAAAAKAHA